MKYGEMYSACAAHSRTEMHKSLEDVDNSKHVHKQEGNIGMRKCQLHTSDLEQRSTVDVCEYGNILDDCIET
jgi:hypothetical protein